jgi:hypothetical protein
MRGEHPHNADEHDAFTRWRRVLNWRPGQRKQLKRRSHRRDHRAARRAARRGRGEILNTNGCA